MLAGPILTIEVPVGADRMLSVSAFDAVVLLAFVVLCRPYRPSSLRGAAAGLWPLAPFGALAVAHSAAFLAFGHDLQLPGLVRETVKYVGFAVNIVMLIVIFRTDPMDRPPPRGALAVAALVIGLGSMAYTWMPDYEGGGAYLTVIGAVLTATAFLLATLPDSDSDRRGTLLTTAALAAALVGLSTIWSKLFLFFTALCALNFVALAGARRLGLRLDRRWIFAALGVLVVLLLTALVYAQQGWRFENSAAVRFDLWSIGVDLASRSFPWGIGLGQFGAWLADIAQYKGENQLRFVHNQFLAFVTEAGASGIVFGLIVVKLVVDAASAWRGLMMAVFICLLLGALTVHDAIGLRALQLLLGYSFAVAVRPGAGGSQRHRLS